MQTETETGLLLWLLYIEVRPMFQPVQGWGKSTETTHQSQDAAFPLSVR